MRAPLTVYIGYDSREDIAYRVAANSLRRHASGPVNIVPLVLEKVSVSGLIRRPTYKAEGMTFDAISKAPQSTEFAISRFLPLLLPQAEGWSVFVDCDVIFMGDIFKLLSHTDSRRAVMCVQHDHQPKESIKMDGQAQLAYPRKNWSSFFAFNANHSGNRRLNLEMLNSLPGRDLHRFCWLQDYEIGALPCEFNWLVNVQPKPAEPIVAHFTLGGPWFRDWKGADYDDYWLEEEHIWRSKSL